MRRSREAYLILIILFLFISSPGLVSAASDPNNDRVIYHWVLARWDTNEQVCRVDIYHDGLPTG